MKTIENLIAVVLITLVLSTQLSCTPQNNRNKNNANNAGTRVPATPTPIQTIQQTYYTISVSASNNGGTVGRSSNEQFQVAGSSITLLAVANSGYVFSGWAGSLEGMTNPVTIIMDENKYITAVFRTGPLSSTAMATATASPAPTNGPSFTLNTSVTGYGSITRNITYPSYNSGTVVTLSALPAAGYTFAGWSGAATGTTNPATVTMNSHKTVAATFALTVAKDCYDIIIVAGQSNAVGYGLCPMAAGRGFNCSNTIIPSLDDKIYQLLRGTPTIGDHYDNDNNGKIELVSATGKLQHWHNSNIDSGFAMTFARDYAKSYLAPNRNILIIPSAMGGTSITEWCPKCVSSKPGDLDLDNKSLYSNMMTMTTYALSRNNSCNRVVAFLWHQGESDCAKDLSVQYEHNLSSVMSSVRNELSSQGNFPIIMGKFVPNWKPSNLDTKTTVENAIVRVSRMSNVSPSLVVSAEDLRSNSEMQLSATDTGHFSSQAQVEFGHRYFNAFLYLTMSPRVMFDSRIFNAEYYKFRNKDLGNLSVDQLRDHWKNHGIEEGRCASENFASQEYLHRYADLRKEFGSAGYVRAIMHYYYQGIGEGRTGRL